MLIPRETGHKKITDRNKILYPIFQILLTKINMSRDQIPIHTALNTKSPHDCAMVATNLAKHSDTFPT